jgi:Glycosyl hydrolase family 76
VRRVVLVVVLAISLLLPAIGAAPVRGGTDNRRRAVDGYAAMQRYLFDARSGRYREAVGAKPEAHAWPVSQALGATIAVAKAPGASPRIAAAAVARLARIEVFRTGPVYAAWPGGDVYWDDNEWLAQDFLADGSVAGVRRAREIFGAVVRAWDNDGSRPCAGGVQWTDAAGNDDRNTVSTVNGALVGLELYGRTLSPSALYWSRKMLDWVDACMLADDGLTWDHIDRFGSVDTTHWSYNEGSLIGALVLLAQETGDASALARAEALADRALAYYSDRWSDEPPEFASIFFVDLLHLSAADGRSDYVAAAQAYADDAWVSHRDPRTGLYAFGQATRLLDQAALVRLYAELAMTAR